jgi:hypothetical protein
MISSKDQLILLLSLKNLQIILKSVVRKKIVWLGVLPVLSIKIIVRAKPSLMKE